MGEVKSSPCALKLFVQVARLSWSSRALYSSQITGAIVIVIAAVLMT